VYSDEKAVSEVATMTPGETVVAMLYAYFDKHLAEYRSYVTAADRSVKSLDALEAELAPAASDLVTDFLFRFTEIHVDSTTISGDSAFVWVSALSPDLGAVLQQASIVERNLGPETDITTKLSVLNERFKIRGSPKEWNHSKYVLIKEAGQWRVHVGWAEQESVVGRPRSE
jgi:hypothetical protein